MKKRLAILSTFSLLVLATLYCVSFSSNSKVEVAEGYTASSLPTTIDLNATSASNIRSYYSSLNNLSTSERQGTNLLKNLKTILKTGQKYYSYENGTSIWQMYEITDRDWDKSPASSTTYGTYNSSTNKITNYTYGTSASSSKNNPYIRAIYVNRNINNQTTAWDDHQQTQWGINREHLWPKAEGFDSSGAGGARGDPMHLVAANGYANNIHSNFYYGFVDTSKSYTDCGTKYSNLSGNLRGTSKTVGGSSNVFEPQDCDKGDIARSIFYMVARYNYLSGSDSDGIDTNNPNLTLTQNLSDWSSSGYTSSTSTQGKLGILTDLLAWHHADPVDEYEIKRNNLLYTNFTNNRNPFIDFPEWVDFIWGTANYSGKTYKSYSSTPTGYATPSSDTINGYNSSGGSTVSVTGVSLNKNSTSIEVGKTEELEETVAPSNATNQGVSWSSSDSTVATVNSYGVVTGVSEGNATIIVTTSDGGFSATCAVTVTASSGGGESGESGTVSVSIADYATANSWANGTKYTRVELDENITASVENGGSNTGKYYTSGNEWRFYQTESGAIEITAASGYELDSVTFTYNVSNTGILLNSSNQQVASGAAQSISGSSVVFHVGNTGSATNGQVKFTNISVTYHSTSSGSAALTGITVDASGCQTVFTVGDEFTYEDLIVTAEYDDESSEQVVPGSVSSPDMSTSGTKTVTVSYGGFEATYTITVNEAIPTSITAQCSKELYYVGETIQKSDITLTDNLSHEITDYSFTDYQFLYTDAPSGGSSQSKTFNITYNNLSTTLTINVQRKSRVNPEMTTDTLTRSLIGNTGTSYIDWNNITSNSSATYAGNTAGKATVSNVIVESIQMRSSNSNSGIVSTTSGGLISSISVVFHSATSSGRTLNIYGKTTAYSAPTDLYSDNTSGTKLGTIVCGTSTSLNITGSYTYIGIRSNSGAIYLESISIIYGTADTAINLSNYIMYEDTANQCNNKFATAKGYFEGLSTAERTTFMTSDDYVISTARTRLEAWARNQGKTINYSDGDYSIDGSKNTNLLAVKRDINISTITIITISAIALVTIGGYFFLRRKKFER